MCSSILVDHGSQLASQARCSSCHGWGHQAKLGSHEAGFVCVRVHVWEVLSFYPFPKVASITIVMGLFIISSKANSSAWSSTTAALLWAETENLLGNSSQGLGARSGALLASDSFQGAIQGPGFDLQSPKPPQTTSSLMCHYDPEGQPRTSSFRLRHLCAKSLGQNMWEVVIGCCSEAPSPWPVPEPGHLSEAVQDLFIWAGF